MRGSSDFCVCESIKTFKLLTLQIGGVPAPTHADKKDSSLGSRNAFLFLSRTRILPAGKVETSKMFL